MQNESARTAALLQNYPVISELPPPLRSELLAAVRWLDLPAGAIVFDESSACAGFPLVLDGAVRVSKSPPSGREITLYRVGPGETCIITTSCLLSASVYRARGQTEGATTLGLVPAPLFERLLQAEPFRRFVFGIFSERIALLMRLVEDVAFRRLDQRLAALLCQQGPRVTATHQKLADELGSVREIVSRLLKGFADEGLVALHREHIDVLDAAALERRAADPR
jgi:CRP/FNR family transcriptional regulator